MHTHTSVHRSLFRRAPSAQMQEVLEGKASDGLGEKVGHIVVSSNLLRFYRFVSIRGPNTLQTCSLSDLSVISL